MRSSNKVIESSQTNLAVQEWLPEQLEDAFGVEMPPAIVDESKPKNGNQPPRHKTPSTPGLGLRKGERPAPVAWTPPELDLSAASHLIGLYLDQSSEDYQQDHDFSEMVKHQKLISNAEAKMNQLIRQAEQQCQQIRAEAHTQGLAAANTEVDQLLRTARAIADEMHAWRESVIAQSEETIVNLVLDIARTLFGSGFVLDSNKIKEVYLRAIRDAKNLGNLVIRVHPEDANLIEGRWLQEQAHFSQSVKLVADSTIKRGGCFIEGENGQVDAHIDTQFATITEKLTDVLAAKTAQQYANQPVYQENPSGKLPGDFGV